MRIHVRYHLVSPDGEDEWLAFRSDHGWNCGHLAWKGRVAPSDQESARELKALRELVARLDEVVATLAELDDHLHEGKRFDYVLTGHRDAERLRATVEDAVKRHLDRHHRDWLKVSP